MQGTDWIILDLLVCIKVKRRIVAGLEGRNGIMHTENNLHNMK